MPERAKSLAAAGRQVRTYTRGRNPQPENRREGPRLKFQEEIRKLVPTVGIRAVHMPTLAATRQGTNTTEGRITEMALKPLHHIECHQSGSTTKKNARALV